MSGVKPLPAANIEVALLLLASTSPPALTRTEPPKVFAPPSCSSPLPVFTSDTPEPAKIDDSASDDTVSV